MLGTPAYKLPFSAQCIVADSCVLPFYSKTLLTPLNPRLLLDRFSFVISDSDITCFRGPIVVNYATAYHNPGSSFLSLQKFLLHFIIFNSVKNRSDDLLP